MGIFGKSDAELKQFADDLHKRDIDMRNREISLKTEQSNFDHQKKLLDDAIGQFENDREKYWEETKKHQERIANERAELDKRRIELSKLEAEAKAAFVEQQREVFKDVIEKRLAELDARQQELDLLENRLSAKLKDVHIAEGEIARRELDVTDREQKADAGFADRARTLANEAARQHQMNLAEADRLRKLADSITEERLALEKAKSKLVLREQAIIAAEQKRDAGFADERAALDIEIRDKRTKAESEIADYREKILSAIEIESAKLKANRLEDITKTEQAERDRIHAEIANERNALTKQLDHARKLLETERIEFEKQKGAVFAMQSELEGRKIELEANERQLERKEQRLEQQAQKRKDESDDWIETQLEEKRKSMEAEKQSLKEENERLRDSIRIQSELIGAFNQLKRQLGDKDPTEILRELNSKSDELKRLREDLATRPTEEMRELYREMASEDQRQKARIEELEKQISANVAAVAETKELRRKNSELDAENKSLAYKSSIFEGAANQAEAELNRLRTAYERPAEVEARYKEIELPLIKAEKIRQPKKNDNLDEITWLTRVSSECDRYGLHFHPRILKAFHTALKIAEWSPLTILAGVSGTGKSELPRLYSHFGGLMFEPLSVQPNWDSQESLLGFFNSIDNKFDAQPVLRFLAQSQKKWIENTNDIVGYPGLQDCVCMVLLDEMNLAHPELYFAEFLSKLELRRGMHAIDVPPLQVKIGAGLPPYRLPLGRNVLWTGTMNQDETTKSLSDKVLDRSNVIYFPRPTTFQRRKVLNILDDSNRGETLDRASWRSWLSMKLIPDNPKLKSPGSDLEEGDIAPFKTFLEDINKSLAVVGRALGHRVWQSVEYYMANYPDVRVAQKAGDKQLLAKWLHTAFEDQLVQKVMPKLRGIDTRGKSKTECLDRILAQINAGVRGIETPFNLAKDFELACELGYGQFIWQSANYLSDADLNDPTYLQDSGIVDSEVPTPTMDAPRVQLSSVNEPRSNVDTSQPPDNFCTNKPDRIEQWNKLTPNQKRMWHRS